MKAKTVKEVLEAARWMLENVGWCQGYFAKSGGTGVWMGRYTNLEDALNEVDCSTVDCFCSMGAINAVEADTSIKRDATIELAKNISSSITGWNDKKGRTKEEVINLFDKAIKGLK